MKNIITTLVFTIASAAISYSSSAQYLLKRQDNNTSANPHVIGSGLSKTGNLPSDIKE